MALTSKEKDIILNSIRDIPDFPKPGIIFKDISTLLSSSGGIQYIYGPPDKPLFGL